MDEDDVYSAAWQAWAALLTTVVIRRAHFSSIIEIAKRADEARFNPPRSK